MLKCIPGESLTSMLKMFSQAAPNMRLAYGALVPRRSTQARTTDVSAQQVAGQIKSDTERFAKLVKEAKVAIE